MSSSPTVTQNEVTTTIPLTTIFTPAQSCAFDAVKTWSIAYINSDNNDKTTFFAEPRNLHACRPSGYANGQLPIFSPGVCPSGYYAAVPSYRPSPATSYCCPLGAAYPLAVGGGASYCYSTFTDNWIQVPGSPSSSSAAGGSILVSLIEIESGTNLGETVAIGIQQPLTVTWQSSDLAQFTPASAPLRNVATSKFMQTTTSTSTTFLFASSSASSGTLSNSSGGLSTGAGAGIGVGVAVAALILLGGLLWWFLRHRRAKRKEQTPSEAAHDYQAVPNADTTAAGFVNKAELSTGGGRSEMEGKGSTREELDANHLPTEAEGDLTQRYELPGDSGGTEVPTEK